MDSIDQKLIDFLIDDPKSTLSELAKKLNVSITAVSKHLKKLESEGYIKYEISLNLQKFNMIHAIMFIETKDARSRANVIERFSKCPLVDKIFDLIGWEYHLAILLVSPDQTLLNNFMTYCPIRYLEGIKRISAYHSFIETNKPLFLPISFRKSRNVESCGTNCATECARYKNQCSGCPAIEYNITDERELAIVN